LGLLVGPELRRKLELRNKTNQELFELYDAELIFRHQSENALREARRLLGHFHQYLGEFPPSVETAKGFLRQYSERKQTTFARYLAVVKGFMAWYGEPLDIKISMPKMLPDYVEPADVAKLLEAMRTRKTHKHCTERDIMLVELACNTGLRRNELAELRVRDIDMANQVLIVRQGKGRKDRAVPLPSRIATRLEAFIAGRDKDATVFGLAASSISGKVHYWAQKAGVNIHTHSLRDNYASTLNERGTSIRAIQELLGHSSLANTERYTLLNPRHLKKAVEVLDDEAEEPKKQDTSPKTHPKASGADIDAALLSLAEESRRRNDRPVFIAPGNPKLKELGPQLDKLFGPRKKAR
jgi:integrase